MHSYCPRIKTLMASWDFRPGFLSVARMRCRQWDCEFCGKKNAEVWRAHLLHTFCELLLDERWVFVTLTAPPSAHAQPPSVSLAVIKSGWGKLYDALRHVGGGKIKYVLIFETHKSGIFHAHCLCNLGAHYDALGPLKRHAKTRAATIKAEKEHPFCVWLSIKAARSGMGWVVHATRIKEGGTGADNARLAVGYISKYLSKAASEVVLPKRARRIQTSRDIGSPRSKAQSKYAWVLKPAISWQNNRIVPHWLISEGRVLGPGDFGDDGHYPPFDDGYYPPLDQDDNLGR